MSQFAWTTPSGGAATVECVQTRCSGSGGAHAEVAAWAEALVLAVKGTAAESALHEVGLSSSVGSRRNGIGEAARAIEPLCQLWCIPGFRSNEWTSHAFHVLRR